MIQNFAAIGYDSNNMNLAAYDWRLSFYNLEVRDKYFSKLKATLELAKNNDGKKSVLVSHSMGKYKRKSTMKSVIANDSYLP